MPLRLESWQTCLRLDEVDRLGEESRGNLGSSRAAASPLTALATGQHELSLIFARDEAIEMEEYCGRAQNEL
jgi:hypothetical protein